MQDLKRLFLGFMLLVLLWLLLQVLTCTKLLAAINRPDIR